MIRTDRRIPILFTVLITLALAGTMLALFVSPAQAQGGYAPAAPVGLRTEAFHDSVVLTWQAPRYAEGLLGYKILRWDIDEQAPGFAVLEENTGTNATTYTDSGVEPYTRYIYQVKSINEHGTSLGYKHVLVVRTPADPATDTEPEQVEEGTATWIGIDFSPASIEQGSRGEATIAATGLELSSLYNFTYDILDENGGNADICEDDGRNFGSLGLSLGTGHLTQFVYVASDRIYKDCPPGSYSLRVVWEKYKEGVGYEYGGTVTKNFEVIPDSNPRTDFERVDYITPLYPDPPATHGLLMFGSVMSPSPSRVGVSIGISGLVPDSDPSTTDYVVSVRVVDEDNIPVEGCNQREVGGSFLIKIVPDGGGGSGRWGINLGTLTQRCVSRLRIEVLNGSFEYLGHVQESDEVRIPPRPDANSPATGAPVISGTARVGETLTADTSGISDDDGLDNATHAYQWIRSDGTTDTEIAEATGTTYVVSADDVDSVLKVRVSFADDGGNDESLTSASTGTVSATVPGAPGSVDVQPAGTGELSVSWQEPASDGGATVTGYTVQWKEAAGNWDSVSDVSTATTTGTSYTITSLSLGTEYSVRVVATNPAGDGPASTEVKETADAQTSQQHAASPNSPATGVPTISGTAPVGESLTADASGIADTDGLSNATFSYQWLADDADIAGAASSIYALTDSDEGKTIKVRVSFTDDAGNKESLTSAPVDPARPDGLTATVSNGAVVLTWKPPEVLSNLYSLSVYRILRNRPELGETEPQVYVEYTNTNETSYTDTDVEPGVMYVYRVKAADFVGRLGEASEPVEIRTPESVAVATNSPATGAPTIGGTARVGETLTADTSGIADEDGLSNAAFSYQWLADAANIAGATSSTYTLTDSDEGKAIEVRVSFTDDAGNEESLTSEATAGTSAAPTPLTASIHDEPESHDGENPFTFELRFSAEFDISYVMLRDHAFRVIGGRVTNARRIDRSSNVHWEITVEPSSDADVSIVLPETTDCDGQGAICTGDGRMLSDEVTLTVAGPAEEEEQTPPQNSPATGVPAVSGTAQVGETLTADTSNIADSDGLVNATYAHQWLADDTDIVGATRSSYTLADADEDKTVKVRVSFTDDEGNEESLTSTATAAVAAAPTPLTASIHSAPDRHDGQNSFTFELRFSEEFELSYVTLRDHAFTVTGGEVTGARRLVSGSNIRWEITVAPDSNATVIVALSPTIDCDDEGAICTADGGRALSNRLELTVRGPGG